MIIPSLRVKWISDEKGYGLFATKFIPRGTITFIQDSLDIVVDPSQFLRKSDSEKAIIEKYSYQNPKGDRIISWDLGKYMNHCCHSNTLTTGYGFEIAIKDIHPDEEVTDDYRIFSRNPDFNTLSCENNLCNYMSIFSNSEQAIVDWDQKIFPAVSLVFDVEQPLISFLDEPCFKQLKQFCAGLAPYVSVREMVLELENIESPA